MITPIQCPLTSLNKKNTIYKIFGVKDEAKASDYDFSINYEYKYIYKGKQLISGKTKLISSFLNVEKENVQLIDNIPDGEDRKNYRPIINFKKSAEWLKNAQRKFHRIISKGLGVIPYLHSTTRKTSYATNGRTHAEGGPKNVFALDISSFFTGISRERVYKTLKQYLQIDNDVAYFYSKMLTAPLTNESSELVLAQGLPSSPILAFLCYKSLFDYINELSVENDIVFTLYVDDITFSSADGIPQSFINTIMGLLKSKDYGNNLIINKRKTHNYKKQSNKRITGVYINNGMPTVSRKKHFELFVQYTKLVSMLHNELDSIDNYFEFYNLYLKFSGNLIHLFQVEYGGVFNATTPNSAHNRMFAFYKEMNKYVKPGLSKNDSRLKYSVENVGTDAFRKANEAFVLIKKNQAKLKKRFPVIKRNIL